MRPIFDTYSPLIADKDSLKSLFDEISSLHENCKALVNYRKSQFVEIFDSNDFAQLSCSKHDPIVSIHFEGCDKSMQKETQVWLSGAEKTAEIASSKILRKNANDIITSINTMRPFYWPLGNIINRFQSQSGLLFLFIFVSSIITVSFLHYFTTVSLKNKESIFQRNHLKKLYLKAT